MTGREFTKILDWPGYRVYRHEIDERARRLTLWVRPAAEAKQGESVFAGSFGTPPDDRNLNQHVLRPAAKAIGCYYEGFGFHGFAG